MREATIYIEGMSCGHCLNAVNRALSALPGVKVEGVRIGRADVRYDETTTNIADLETAVADAGYRGTVEV